MKAQLTLMMILGIVMLLAVGLVYYLAGAKEKRPDAETQRISQLALQPVRDYITACLDLVARQGMQLMAKQGGVLYVSQGSTIDDFLQSQEGTAFVEHEQLKVQFNILRPIGSVANYFFSTIPAYPFATFPYKGNATSWFGYYGKAQLYPLYKTSQDSIQEMLEAYVATNIVACPDWSTFEPSGLQMTAGTANASMVFAENLSQLQVEQYVSFVLNWPVQVFQPATGASVRLEDFVVQYPIKLGSFYFHIKSLIDTEATDISFEPNATARFSVIVEQDKFGYDDLITVKDLSSILGAEPLAWQLVRKNRAPALWLINQSLINQTAYCDGSRFSVQGTTLTVQPQQGAFPIQLNASDPDDDSITYSLEPSTPQIGPVALGKGFLKFKVKASDGELHDYQDLTVGTTVCIAS